MESLSSHLILRRMKSGSKYLKICARKHATSDIKCLSAQIAFWSLYVIPLCALAFSHPISFGTNFALISRVELVFLSASRVSPLSRDVALRSDERKQIRGAGEKKRWATSFAVAEARASWKSTVTKGWQRGWVLRVQVNVNTLQHGTHAFRALRGYVYSASVAGQTTEFAKRAYVARQSQEISQGNLHCDSRGFVSNTYVAIVMQICFNTSKTR